MPATLQESFPTTVGASGWRPIRGFLLGEVGASAPVPLSIVLSLICFCLFCVVLRLGVFRFDPVCPDMSGFSRSGSGLRLSALRGAAAIGAIGAIGDQCGPAVLHGLTHIVIPWTPAGPHQLRPRAALAGSLAPTVRLWLVPARFTGQGNPAAA